MVLSIEKADYKGDYVIGLRFSDGVESNIDFGSFLRNAKNPMTKEFLDNEIFKSFTREYGELIWNGYEICFPFWDLHEGKI